MSLGSEGQESGPKKQFCNQNPTQNFLAISFKSFEIIFRI